MEIVRPSSVTFDQEYHAESKRNKFVIYDKETGEKFYFTHPIDALEQLKVGKGKFVRSKDAVKTKKPQPDYAAIEEDIQESKRRPVPSDLVKEPKEKK